jgi:DNA-binding Lrp family transcriptional regulator
MATAFLLLNTETGREADVVKGLKELKEIKEAHLTYGSNYEVIARMETATMGELKDAVNWKVKHVRSVLTTLTMIVV